MGETPKKPLDDMQFLDGYLGYHYTNHSIPDGAWFQACVDAIELQWPKCDAHETFMEYVEWKGISYLLLCIVL